MDNYLNMKNLLNYQECLKQYKNDYQIKKALKEHQLYKINDGLYSRIENPSDLEIFIKKHSNAIFTMESAFYFLGISDFIPTRYYVATSKNSTKLFDKDITQYFMDQKILNIGKTKMKYNQDTIVVYNKERMLIEIVRYKNKMPYDYYKEIVSYYRNHIDEIDVALVLDYVKSFPKKDFILKIIETEIL